MDFFEILLFSILVEKNDFDLSFSSDKLKYGISRAGSNFILKHLTTQICAPSLPRLGYGPVGTAL